MPIPSAGAFVPPYMSKIIDSQGHEYGKIDTRSFKDNMKFLGTGKVSKLAFANEIRDICKGVRVTAIRPELGGNRVVLDEVANSGEINFRDLLHMPYPGATLVIETE